MTSLWCYPACSTLCQLTVELLNEQVISYNWDAVNGDALKAKPIMLRDDSTATKPDWKQLLTFLRGSGDKQVIP